MACFASQVIDFLLLWNVFQALNKPLVMNIHFSCQIFKLLFLMMLIQVSHPVRAEV